ncbi:MAG TPA: response regulator transcription factor [Chloroflexi bacterium]|nr:response regulator transcription factor [Chloroflexota bacterium]
MGHILVVDDEPAIVTVVRERLERDGFSVRAVASGEDALEQIGLDPPDLLVLDLMLPGMDGLDVLRKLRGQGNMVPVVVLSARDEDVDKIVGLELGADDYLAKPFNPRELTARIRAVLRRRQEAKTLEDEVTQMREAAGAVAPEEGLRFDESRRRVWFRNQLLDLRPREYDLLGFLARHRGQVFSRDALLSHVWGCESYIGQRTVDVHVRRLRAKLANVDPEADVILTEWGVGYRMAEDI